MEAKLLLFVLGTPEIDAMAILLLGKTVCSLCGQVIKADERRRSFPAFVANEEDPLFLFSDASFHEDCLRRDKRGRHAIERVEERAYNVGPGKRKCAVCGLEVTDPDNYIFIEHLSDHKSDPLREFNYTHLHKSCVGKWGRKAEFVRLVEAALAAGRWRGKYLAQLLEEFRQRLN